MIDEDASGQPPTQTDARVLYLAHERIADTKDANASAPIHPQLAQSSRARIVRQTPNRHGLSHPHSTKGRWVGETRLMRDRVHSLPIQLRPTLFNRQYTAD